MAPHETSVSPAERPALLPAASSLQPTHITSHLPPLKSLQSHNHSASRDRSPFRRRKDITPPSEKPPAQPAYKHRGLPNTNTLQTFLTVTDVPHFGHAAHYNTHHHFHRHDSGDGPAHSADPGHGWRVRKTPIFSGLLAPFSIVLEVPGLTSKWYAKIDADGIVERYIDNPPILTVGLAISLSAAVVANAAIIFRFLEFLKPRASIALAIAGFALHDIINVVALAVFGGIYGPKHDGLSLSASYWMVCASTITSTIVTISLIADYVRTKDFKHAGSGLTQLQKGLVLAGMGLLLYLSLGSLIFVYLIKIDFITALYFSTATVLTVGFGDVVPTSPGGKVLVILYAPIGIILVALVVSSARSTILETFQAALIARTKERRRRIAERKAAVKEHKRQDRAIRRIMPRTFTFGPNSNAVSNSPDDDSNNNEFAEALAQMEKQAAAGGAPPADNVASSITTTAASSGNAASNDEPKLAEAEKPATATVGDPALQHQIHALQDELLAAKKRTEQDFLTYEEHARHEAVMAARMKLVLAASVTAAFWLLGAVAFTYAERWSYGGAMWFCFIAMITIGYGDYHPTTQIGRAIFVIWGLMGVAVLTILLAVVQDAFGGVLHRMLTQSTSRLFDRAEERARKRRLKKEQMQREQRQADAEEEGEDVETRGATAGASAMRKRRRSRTRSHRKSESDVKREKFKMVEAGSNDTGERTKVERKSMEATFARDRHTSSPEPLQELERDLDTPDGVPLAIPSFILKNPSGVTDSGLITAEVQLPVGAAARVEDTLVSAPQKLALAALLTFQHSVRVLRLHDTAISAAMTDVPALRHYYNSRQKSSSLSGTDLAPQDPSEGNTKSKDGEETDPETALQNLHAAIQQTANPEYEKVAKLVVANLEFEHHLKVFLEQFQGLKDRVEGFKQRTTEMRRRRGQTVGEADGDEHHPTLAHLFHPHEHEYEHEHQQPHERKQESEGSAPSE